MGSGLLRAIDSELAKKGFSHIRQAVVSTNAPMKALCSRFSLEFVSFRMCQCGERSIEPMRALRVHAPAAALMEFIVESDYYKLSQGMMLTRPGQFKALSREELEARVGLGNVYILGSLTAIQAVAIIGASGWGPNPCICFAAGAKVAELMDDMRCLIPADHPRGAGAAELFGYLPLGSAAYKLAAEKVVLPSGTNFYCPRETLEMVTEWKAGTL